MKIYAPVKDTNGVYASVMFVNGVGETHDPHLIEWFKIHGYRLEEDTIAPVKVDEIVEETIDEAEEIVDETVDETVDENNESDKPDFESMTPNDLREWMMENGYGSKIRNTRNKEKLLEILRG